jgi:hypothetical protein
VEIVFALFINQMHFSDLGVHNLLELIVLLSGSLEVVFENTFAALALVVLFLDFLILLVDQIFKVIDLFFEITNVVTVLSVLFISEQVGSVELGLGISQFLISLAFERGVTENVFFDLRVQSSLFFIIELALLNIFLDLGVDFLVFGSDDFIQFLNFIVETVDLVFVVDFERGHLIVVDAGGVLALVANLFILFVVEFLDFVFELMNFISQRNVFIGVIILLATVLVHESLNFVVLEFEQLLQLADFVLQNIDFILVEFIQVLDIFSVVDFHLSLKRVQLFLLS